MCAIVLTLVFGIADVVATTAFVVVSATDADDVLDVVAEPDSVALLLTLDLSLFFGLTLSKPNSLNILSASLAPWSFDASILSPEPWHNWGGSVVNVTNVKYSEWLPFGKSQKFT